MSLCQQILTLLRIQRTKPSRKVQRHPEEFFLSRGNGGGYVLAQGETDGLLSQFRVVDWLVPAFAPSLVVSVGPNGVGHRFQRQPRNAFLLRMLQDLRAELSLFIKNKVHWEHHRVELETVHQGYGRLGVMRGCAQEAHFALLASLEERLRGSPDSEDFFHIFQARNSVELVKIKVVRLQPIQALLQFFARTGGVPCHGLAGQECPHAIRL